MAGRLEADHMKLNGVPPGQVIVGSDQVKVAQVACGLQHTVLLCDDGSVYTFGSNHYGQLGLEVRDKQCVKSSCCSFCKI